MKCKICLHQINLNFDRCKVIAIEGGKRERPDRKVHHFIRIFVLFIIQNQTCFTFLNARLRSERQEILNKLNRLCQEFQCQTSRPASRMQE